VYHVLQVIWGECIAGALYLGDFLRIAKEAGFADPRILHQGHVSVNDPDIQVPPLPTAISENQLRTHPTHLVIIAV